jgi:hypothetical protein
MAQRRTRSFERTTLCAAVTLLFLASSSVNATEAEQLIAGVVSRSTAIASGRITYKFKSESFVGERALPPVLVAETTTSFSNSSWAERTKSSALVRINHGGYFLEFVKTPQPNGSVRPGAILYPQRSLASRKELNAPPLYAGTFWHPEQTLSAEKHASNFQSAGSATINGIPVVLLELAVPAESQREAFHMLLPALKSGGMIRLYVAPQLGFVMPRIEFLTPTRQVAHSYESVDFGEVAPGIHFPRRLSTETHAASGGARYRGEFALSCELVNQSIPEEDFVVDLPVGTRIQDARQPGEVLRFELDEPSSSSVLLSLTSGSESGPPGRFMDRWRNAIIVGVVIGTVALSCILLASRAERYRGASTTPPTRVFKRA